MFNTKKTLIAAIMAAGFVGAASAEVTNPALADTKTPVINKVIVEHKGDVWKYTNMVTGQVVTYKGDPAKYLDPARLKPLEEKAKKDGKTWRQALMDGDNDYSYEVDDKIDGGNAGNAECTIPNAFAQIHINAAQNYNAPHSFYKFGQPITEEAIQPWNIDVDAGGRGLPDPSVGMTVAEGEVIYQKFCAECHGEFGESAKGYLPLAGNWELKSTNDDFAPAPFRSIGNYWPYLTTAFDYIRRTMPFWAPNNPAIGDAGYMGIVGFLTYLNEIPIDSDGTQLEEDTFFNSELLMKANAFMPNQNNFFCDDRPVVHQVRCMSNCPDEVVGNGKGDVTKFRGPKLLPDGSPQYNTNEAAQQKGVRYAGAGREP